MEQHINLEELWSGQSVPQPEKESILQRAKAMQRRKFRQSIFAGVSLSLTILFVIWVWYFFQPEYLSTKLGIILVIVAMLVYLGMVLMLNPIYAKLDATEINQSYLAQLLLIRKREIQLETVGTNFYFLILSTGLALYLFEYALRMPAPGLILTYAITGSWILFNWFYFRPRIIQKNREKRETLIRQVQDLIRQLQSE